MGSESLGPARELIDSALLLAELLEQAKVRYALIGGLAAGYRTESRATVDVDVLLSVPQLELPGLLERLREAGFDFDLPTVLREFGQDHMTVLWYHGIKIDWLKPVLPVYQHILDRATPEKLLGRPVRVASAEGLILMKLLAARTRDWVDIENLVAGYGDHLDDAWIQAEWHSLAEADDPRMKRFLELLARARSGSASTPN